MRSFYKIGPLNVRLSGPDKMVALIGEEFLFSSTPPPSIDLYIDVYARYNNDYRPSHFSGKGSMNFNAEVFHVSFNNYYYFRVENAFAEGPVKVSIILKKVGLVIEVVRFLKSILSVEHVSRFAYVKGLIASYSLLWSIVALCLLKNGYSFIHAGILARNNKGIVLSGTGGCGKTSTVLNLLSSEGFQYLSEDFGIVGCDGFAHACMKTVSLYRSDIDHKDPAALNAVKSLNMRKRIRWEILTRLMGRNPLIKAKPNFLTNLEIPSQKVRLSYGIHLSRQDIKSFLIRKIPLQEYAERSMNASGRELKPLTEILKLISANAPKSYGYWDDAKLMCELSRAYIEAFNNSNTFELCIPYKASPKEVSLFLLDNLVI